MFVLITFIRASIIPFIIRLIILIDSSIFLRFLFHSGLLTSSSITVAPKSTIMMRDFTENSSATMGII